MWGHDHSPSPFWIGGSSHAVIDALEQAGIPIVEYLFESLTRAALCLFAGKDLWRYVAILENDHEHWASYLHAARL